MDQFFIVTNPTKDPQYETTDYIRRYLEKRGKICTLNSQDAECILVLGGDGTLLRAAVEMADEGIPFLGINLGNLGFLAEVERSGIDKALNRLIEGDVEIEKRMMLVGAINDKPDLQGGIRALNEIVITGKSSMQLINFQVYVNKQLLNRYYADGMIIATPTGSTGYNLSAGGPIIEPRAEMILLTPICPHSLHSRSIILSPEDTVTVEVGEDRNGMSQELNAVFDGTRRLNLMTGDRIQIGRSEKTTAIIKLSQVSFLEILHKKMSD